ncbi:MAG: hypothetical protein AB8B95_14295 [Pseudohongiellaceae bacterium]
MTAEIISAISEVVAAIAVVLSLIYLAKQVKQANSLAKGQTRQRMVEQAQEEVYKGFIEEPSIFKSMYKSEPLTEVEWIQLTGWLLAAMRQREFEWFQMQDGNIDEKLWDAYKRVITIHLGTPRVRKWWDTNGHFPFDKSFCAMVSELLDEHGETSYFEDFKSFINLDST